MKASKSRMYIIFIFFFQSLSLLFSEECLATDEQSLSIGYLIKIENSANSEGLILSEKPSNCDSDKTENDVSKINFSPEDVFLITGSCGQWVSVRRVGNAKVRGWIYSKRLRYTVENQGDPIKHLYKTEIIDGQDNSLCLEIKNKLASAAFQVPPICGLPPLASSPNLLILSGKTLSKEENINLFPSAYSFSITGSQVNGRTRGPWSDDLISHGYSLIGDQSGGSLFEKNIDIDNDGMFDKVLLWKRIESSDLTVCDYENPAELDQGYILNKRGNKINQSATRSVFWSEKIDQSQKENKLYSPLLKTINFFKYNNLFYYAGISNEYPSDSSNNGRTAADKISYEYDVYKSEGGKRFAICRFSLQP